MLLVESDEDVEKISLAYKEAYETSKRCCTRRMGVHEMMDSVEALKIISRHRVRALLLVHDGWSRMGQVSTNTDLDIPWVASMGRLRQSVWD